MAKETRQLNAMLCPRWDHRIEKGHQVKTKVIILQYINVSSQPVAYLKLTGFIYIQCIYIVYEYTMLYISVFEKTKGGKLIFINLYISRKNSFCEKAFWNEIGKL